MRRNDRNDNGSYGSYFLSARLSRLFIKSFATCHLFVGRATSVGQSVVFTSVHGRLIFVQATAVHLLHLFPGGRSTSVEMAITLGRPFLPSASIVDRRSRARGRRDVMEIRYTYIFLHGTWYSQLVPDLLLYRSYTYIALTRLKKRAPTWLTLLIGYVIG